MSALNTTPAAVITHTVATIRGQQLADLSVYDARTRDIRIALLLLRPTPPFHSGLWSPHC